MFQEVIIYNYNSQENQSIELAYTTFVIKNGRKLPLSYNKMLHAIKRRDTITMLFPFFFLLLWLKLYSQWAWGHHVDNIQQW